MLTQIAPSKGKLLVSEPFMLDPNFKRSVVFLAEHDEEGSIGFVLNQPMQLQLNDVMPPDFPKFAADLYVGGPVGQDTLHYVHSLGKQLTGSNEIMEGVFLGGDLESLKVLITDNAIAKEQIRFFIGYSGWDSGQLDKELEENTWLVSITDATHIFSNELGDLWKHTVRNMGNRYRHIANFPEEPIWN